MIELRASTLPEFKVFFNNAVEKHLEFSRYIISESLETTYLFEATAHPDFIDKELLIKCGEQFALCYRHPNTLFVYTEESVAYIDFFN